METMEQQENKYVRNVVSGTGLLPVSSLHGCSVHPVAPVSHTSCLVPTSPLHTHTPRLNSNKTSIVRCSRRKYERLYPVLLVKPNGAAVNIRYKEPRQILLMPVDFSTLSEEDRKARLKRRDVKKTVTQPEVHYDDDFKADDYSQFWMKK
ncbi:39S ribosomal protein L55, mitochondrial isoform X2 [Lampris incognitus]|uniref:39S ribosomal protein L55, mitochondrial isoform X2 n=1 Tax=Lampris incognitus TaxID=2546036 RepID=UPI0024B49913|nr:39S ribosomal protein L55, mitochondrial isoform X2 [Lampris incognitus]